MSLLAASVALRSVRSGLAAARAAKRMGADVVEFRLDHLPPRRLDMVSLKGLRESPLPLIATLRPAREGGRYRGTEKARIALLLKAVESGFEFADIELSLSDATVRGFCRQARSHGGEAIASHHSSMPAPSPDHALGLANRAWRLGATVAKLAFRSGTMVEAGSVVAAAEALSRSDGAFTVMGIGKEGPFTRYAAWRLGAAFVYCSVGGRPTAKGQVPLAPFRRITAIRNPQSKIQNPKSKIRNRTALYGVVGWPLERTLSPVMHNEAFRRRGSDALYLPVPVRPEAFESALPSLFASGFKGLNITTPYKERVLPLLGRVDGEAARAGAVNTIVPEGDRLCGYNTDGIGVAAALGSRGVRVDGRRALLLGAGGAARAAAFMLAQLGGETVIANRTPEKAEALARAVGKGASAIPLQEAPSAARDSDILMNFTPAGSGRLTDLSPLPPSAISGRHAVFDAVYYPLVTPFIRVARMRGAKIVPGFEMLFQQGAAAFHLFTGQSPPVGAMRWALIEELLRNPHWVKG